MGNGVGIGLRELATRSGCSSFAEFADDGPFAGWAGLTVVTYEEMFDDFVDAGVLEAGELSILIKGKIAGAPDLAQSPEDSARFALEDLQFFTHRGRGNGPTF
jgi:hypothetical protein